MLMFFFNICLFETRSSYMLLVLQLSGISSYKTHESIIDYSKFDLKEIWQILFCLYRIIYNYPKNVMFLPYTLIFAYMLSWKVSMKPVIGHPSCFWHTSPTLLFNYHFLKTTDFSKDSISTILSHKPTPPLPSSLHSVE